MPIVRFEKAILGAARSLSEAYERAFMVDDVDVVRIVAIHFDMTVTTPGDRAAAFVFIAEQHPCPCCGQVVPPS